VSIDLKIGLIIARQNQGLSEANNFLSKFSGDLLLFPEGFISSKNLKKLCQLAKKYKKWIVSGMDDRRDKEIFETAVVINPKGKLVGEHKKTSITKSEIEDGYSRGGSIEIINTDFGKIGVAICYEIHFPEVARILALKGARIIFNPIGTGMWHEKQYKIWTRTAAARAAENGVFVVGCSHFNDAIPIGFACDPEGNFLVRERSVNKLIPVTVDFSKYKKFSFDQRRPELYEQLVKK